MIRADLARVALWRVSLPFERLREAGLAAATFVLAVATIQKAAAQQVPAVDEGAVEEVVVTGSRIRRDPLNERAPLTVLDGDALERTGLTNLGDALQNLPVAGSAPNSQFNVPGNSGFPQDGAGIGAGSVQVALRNVGSKRTLVLVDGRRWIAGASASGVPGHVDLNSIPDNVIARVEVLQDGASAIYGSDAIGGVVNIITDRNFNGLSFDLQTGGYLGEGDGESTAAGVKWGAGNETTHLVLSASYRDERGVETAARARSAFPNPDATSCDVPATLCSSFTPQGRFVFGPNLAGGASITLNDGVLNDGLDNLPRFDPANPHAGDFHAFTAADRFNYNGPGFNFLRTPNERVNLFASARHTAGPSTELFATLSYTNRSSATRAAPEPLCLGSGCGNRINEQFLISAENPYNPFGADLAAAAGTLAFFGRRPLESGPREFYQDVDTYFGTFGVEGELRPGGRSLFWEAYGSYGENRGFQEKYNSHNAARLQIAMGDPAVCAATPGCVPFNFFGGQGPDGAGSITQDMLDYVTFTQRDFSDQKLANAAFNLSGELFSMPAGEAGVAAGIEFRDHDGSFRPDPIAERGETAGIPAGSTRGGFDVTEYYAELNLPLVSSGVRYWDLNLAVRNSDYSTFGSESTYQVNTLFRPADAVTLRASHSTGFRAPGIGELFGGAAREDFLFLDTCVDVLGQAGSANGGRDEPQPQGIVANCASLGVPANLIQTNPQLSAVSAGNRSLDPETSEQLTAGIVFSSAPSADWIENLTLSADYYDLTIDDAIQGRTPSDVIAACVATLDPLFCDLVPRTAIGVLGVIDNRLQNIGGIEASGYDVSLAVSGPQGPAGRFNATFNASFLSSYEERTANIDGTETVTDRAGTHTSETFQRAFPKLRWVTTLDWSRDRWAAGLSLRWTDSMSVDGTNGVDSSLFADLVLTYRPRAADDGWTVSLGFNNLFDEDPPVCFGCGVTGMSQVVHDLPGRVGYLRVNYRGSTASQ